MSDWTREPWFTIEQMEDNHRYPERVKNQVQSLTIPRADYERACHCVNALAGFPDPEADVKALVEAIKWAENCCPCGARPESLNTHPHVPGCPIDRALHRLRREP